MTKYIILLILLTNSPNLFAYTNPLFNEEEICKYTGVSRADNECSQKRFDAVEEVLNGKYKEFMGKLDIAIARQPERLKDLKKGFIHAQREWIKYREKECSALSVWYTGGTLKYSYYLTCMKRIALQRIEEFKYNANPGK